MASAKVEESGDVGPSNVPLPKPTSDLSWLFRIAIPAIQRARLNVAESAILPCDELGTICLTSSEFQFLTAQPRPDRGRFSSNLNGLMFVGLAALSKGDSGSSANNGYASCTSSISAAGLFLLGIVRYGIWYLGAQVDDGNHGGDGIRYHCVAR